MVLSVNRRFNLVIKLIFSSMKKGNWSHFGTKNPNLRFDLPLHFRMMTVLCGTSLKRINGPISIDGMVTGVKYREMIGNYFGPEMGHLYMTSSY